jgi:hypothetical protein
MLTLVVPAKTKRGEAEATHPKKEGEAEATRPKKEIRLKQHVQRKK